MIGRGNVGTHGQHVGQTHPSTPSHAPGTALPSAGIASKEKQGAARGCSFGKAGRCFGSGMAARIGNLDWEFGLGISWVFPSNLTILAWCAVP